MENYKKLNINSGQKFNKYTPSIYLLKQRQEIYHKPGSRVKSKRKHKAPK